MDYSQLSDFEINKRVADIVMNGTWHIRPSHTDNTTGGWLYGSNGIQTYDLPDYCKSPADAWPIIVDGCIALKPVPLYVGGCRWFATKGEGDLGIKHADNNPLRAAMIVFLMIQEKADANS
jgi:hypothetical protein